jgi:hypothetical protein
MSRITINDIDVYHNLVFIGINHNERLSKKYSSLQVGKIYRIVFINDELLMISKEFNHLYKRKYFITLKEYRKRKLEKLNEIN